jgi:hypothetical protein
VKLTKAFCLELAMGRNLAELSAQLAREEQRTAALTARMAIAEAAIEKMQKIIGRIPVSRVVDVLTPRGWEEVNPINPKHWCDSDI